MRWKQLAGRIAVSAATAGTVLAFSTAPASAAGFWFDGQNRATRKCLDDSNLGLRTWECNRQEFQQFWAQNHKVDGTLYRSIRNKVTNRCVDDSFESGLRSYPCNGGAWQDWRIYGYDKGYVLKNRATGRCLDDSGAGLRTWECNGMDFQYWYGVYAS